MKQALVRIIAQTARLIDVKSIVTITLVGALVYTTLRGIEPPALFSNAVMLVLGFFFSKNIKSSPEID
jgi:hypothetical protein